MTEGNYASLEKSLWDTPVNSDLGLTLLPGSQIQTKDEKGSGSTAGSCLKEAGNGHDKILEQLRSLGAEIQVKNTTQQSALLNNAKAPKSFPSSGSESANLSYVTADLNRARPFSQISTVKNDGTAVGNAGSAHAALNNEQQIGSSEIRNDENYQRGSYSSRLAKWKKLGIQTSNGIQGSKVSKVKDSACETHNDTSYMHYNQGLYKNDTIQSGKGLESFRIIGLPLSGTGRGSKSSKPELHRQIKCSLDVAPEAIFPPILSFTSRLQAKHPQYPSRKPSKVLTQHLRHSRLPPDTHANIRVQLLNSGKRVNKRSWTTYFPAKARFSTRTKTPKTSFLVAPSKPNQTHQHRHMINPTLTSTNSYPHTSFSGTSPTDKFLKHPPFSKAFDDLISLGSLEGTFNTAHTGNHRQSAPRRSASMPNLWSTRVPTIMDSSKNFTAASMPTPPSEMESFGLHTRQNYARFFTTQDVSGPSIPMNSATAAGGLQHHRQRLGIKPHYSYEEVMSLVAHFTEQAQNLKAENINLQCSNTALKKHVEGLQSEKGAMVKLINYHERTADQKDQQNEAMRQKMMSVQKQHKQMWDNYCGLIATLRKENGNGNPSAIAQRIRQGHAHDATSPASQGDSANQSNVNAPTVYLTNHAQLSIARPEFEQIYSGVQRQVQVQPLSVSGGLEADVRDASSRSLQQQARASANHNRTNPLQTMASPAYPESNLANTSSQGSVTPGFVAANHNMRFPHDQPTRCMQPIIPSDAAVGTVTTSVSNDNCAIGHVSPERVTIDLTDGSQPPVRSASCSHSVHQTSQLAVNGGLSPFNVLPGQCSQPQYPAVNRAQSQSPSALSAQNQSLKYQLPLSQSSQSPDREAMQIQREAIARMAKKPLCWLKGENPFRKETKVDPHSGPPNRRQFSQSTAQGLVISTDSPKEGSVAPLPETATGRGFRDKEPGNARAVLTAEAKKERARVYRKKAADKKKREREATKQLLQPEAISTNAMRARKQERRASKMGKRQEQSQNPLGGVGLHEPQKTLDDRLYQEGISVLQAVPQASIDQAPSDDHDSLFGDDEEGQMEMEDSETSPEEADGEILEDGVDSAFVAELEAELSADADATMWTGLEQTDTLGGGEGHVGAPCESEESEEE